MSRILRSLSWLLYATVPILTIFMLSKCLVILMPSVALLINPVLTSATPTTGIDLSYHPPSVNIINSLPAVLNSTGVFGFVFDSSQTSSRPYSTYNWCNMPHVRPQEYIIPPADFSLKYVEVIHRHHKRNRIGQNYRSVFLTFTRNSLCCKHISRRNANLELHKHSSIQLWSAQFFQRKCICACFSAFLSIGDQSIYASWKSPTYLRVPANHALWFGRRPTAWQRFIRCL